MSILSSARSAARAVLAHPYLAPLWSPLTSGAAPVLMFHRFRDPATGSLGHEAERLRAHLALLRRLGYQVLPLAELLARLREGARGLRKVLALTVDDGYGDFARIAAPIFAEFDCPVTVFVVSGFLDGKCWLWWDRIDFAAQQLPEASVDLLVAGARVEVLWRNPAQRQVALAELYGSLKRVSWSELETVVAQFAATLGVELPERPPPPYAPLTWDEARRCSRNGVTFGPHSVTHPVLSRVDDERVAFEIDESWSRVRAETGAVVPVFCYPDGDRESITPREHRLLAERGFVAGLTALEGYVTPRCFDRGNPSARYEIPRYPYHEDRAAFLQVVTGLERAKRLVRGA